MPDDPMLCIEDHCTEDSEPFSDRCRYHNEQETKRQHALERHARFVYDYDRDDETDFEHKD